MAQKKILIDGIEIWQPDSPMTWDFETTFTPDSSRPQSGEGHFTRLFTVHSQSYVATSVPREETKKILELVIGRNYELYAFIPYLGKWGTGVCYTGKGTFNLRSLEEDYEKFDLSFNAVYLNPLKIKK